MLAKEVGQGHEPGLHIVAAGGGFAAYVHGDRARGLPVNAAPVRILRQFAAAHGVGYRVVPELAKEGGDKNVLPSGKGAGGFLNDETLGHAADSGGVPDKFIRQAEAEGGGADVLLQMRVQLFVRTIHHEGLDALGGLESRDHAAAENRFAGQAFARALGQVAKESFGPHPALRVLNDKADAAADLRGLHLKTQEFVAVEKVVQRHGYGGITAHLVGTFGLVNVKHQIRLDAAAGSLAEGVALDHMISERTGKAVEAYAINDLVGLVGRVGHAVRLDHLDGGHPVALVGQDAKYLAVAVDGLGNEHLQPAHIVALADFGRLAPVIPPRFGGVIPCGIAAVGLRGDGRADRVGRLVADGASDDRVVVKKFARQAEQAHAVAVGDIHLAVLRLRLHPCAFFRAPVGSFDHSREAQRLGHFVDEVGHFNILRIGRGWRGRCRCRRH